jgi:hypothetical protein
MFGRERSLATRYQGQPFVVLGVNAEPSREALQAVQRKYNLPWRSWWDGGGHIASEWSVEGYPSFFLIDHRGAVRYQYAGAPPAGVLEAKIEALLKEAQAS